MCRRVSALCDMYLYYRCLRQGAETLSHVHYSFFVILGQTPLA